MTQRSMFFDSVSGDRIYTSDAWAEIWASVFPDGVISVAGSTMGVLQNTPAAMNVLVSAGTAVVQGRFFQVYGSMETLTIGTSDPVNPRIDRVIIRLDFTARTLALAVKAGTAAVSPSAPTLEQDASKWEISLAQVAVAAGATSILSANITSEVVLVAATTNLSFKNVFVVGGSGTVAATTSNDTLNLAPSTNIAMTPIVGSKQVQVAVSPQGPGSNLNADKLDNLDSTAFSLTGHNHDATYLRLDGTFPATGPLTIDAPASTSFPDFISQQTHGGNLPSFVCRTLVSGVDDVVYTEGGSAGARSAAITATAGLTVNGGKVPTIAGGGAKISAQSTAPTSPVVGDVWIDTSVVL